MKIHQFRTLAFSLFLLLLSPLSACCHNDTDVTATPAESVSLSGIPYREIENCYYSLDAAEGLSHPSYARIFSFGSPLTGKENGLHFAQSALQVFQSEGRGLDLVLSSVTYFSEECIWCFTYCPPLNENGAMPQGGVLNVLIDGKNGDFIIAIPGV